MVAAAKGAGTGGRFIGSIAASAAGPQFTLRNRAGLTESDLKILESGQEELDQTAPHHAEKDQHE